MNRDLITLNEVLNAGNSIFFYQEETTGAWVAYGYSAYLLAQTANCNFISSFSKVMQMPCTCVSEADFKKIVRVNMSTIECLDGFYYLPCPSSVDDINYQQWVQDLKAISL